MKHDKAFSTFFFFLPKHIKQRKTDKGIPLLASDGLPHFLGPPSYPDSFTAPTTGLTLHSSL